MVEILVNKIKLFVWAGGAAIKKIRRAAREFQMQTKVCLPSLEMHSMFWCPLILIIIFWFPSYFSDISANPFIRVISPSVASSCHQRVKTSSQHKLFNDVSGNVSILQLHCSFVYWNFVLSSNFFVWIFPADKPHWVQLRTSNIVNWTSAQSN